MRANLLHIFLLKNRQTWHDPDGSLQVDPLIRELKVGTIQQVLDRFIHIDNRKERQT